MWRRSLKPDRRTAAGLDHVALEDRIARMQHDGDAVAHDGDVADDLVDPANRVVVDMGGVVRTARRLRLRIFVARGSTGTPCRGIGGRTIVTALIEISNMKRVAMEAAGVSDVDRFGRRRVRMSGRRCRASFPLRLVS
jgi:hypothetical protein